MHIHILGIGGTFMGGLAQLAQAAGHRVSGCDAQLYPPMSEQLAAASIEVVEGFGAEQLALAPDLWVVGNVARRGMPLVEAILDAGLPLASGPEWVARHVLRGRAVLAVAGTHGKTTTASMLAWILDCAGLHPGFLIGGVPANFGISARFGGVGEFGDRAAARSAAAVAGLEPAAGNRNRPWFVIEADEYDTAFFDKRSKFVHYFPRIALLNNLEFDHADIFPDLAAIETQFHHLVRCVPAAGRLVVNAGSAALERVLARGCWSTVERFDDDAGWHAAAVVDGAPQQFDVCFGPRRHGRLRLPQAGAHNRANALAAIAAAAAAGIAPALSIDALARFAGVKRRLEARGTERGVTVYDDFAHHPTAIAATLQGLRAQVGAARILALFEPRSNTMRRGALGAQLPASLAAADLVFCLAAPAAADAAAGATAGATAATGWDAAAALAPLGARVQVHTDLARMVAAVAAAARPGDRIVAMSNGGFGAVHERLLAALAQRPPVPSPTAGAPGVPATCTAPAARSA